MDIPSIAAPRDPWRGVAAGLAALQAVVAAALLVTAQRREAAVMLSFLLPMVGLVALPVRLPAPHLALATLALAVSAAGSAFHWYVAWAPFDALVHFLNLLAMMAPSMHFLWRARLAGDRPGGTGFVGLAVLWGLLLGLSWEVLETLFLDLTLADTLSDLLLDAGGAALGGVLAGALIRAGGIRPVR